MCPHIDRVLLWQALLAKFEDCRMNLKKSIYGELLWDVWVETVRDRPDCQTEAPPGAQPASSHAAMDPQLRAVVAAHPDFSALQCSVVCAVENHLVPGFAEKSIIVGFFGSPADAWPNIVYEVVVRTYAR